jgi:hypothetical protein
MKSIFSSTGIIVFLMVFVLVSCKKDPENSFIGKWDVTTHVYTVYQNNVKFSEENYTYLSGEFVVVFNADGTGKFLENGKDGITFTWKRINGDKFTIVEQVDPYTTQTTDLELVVIKDTLTWNSTVVLGTSGEYKFVNYMVCSRL